VNQALKETVLGKTGEVYLVNREGYFLSSSRFGVAILRDRIPKLPGSQDGPDEKIHELLVIETLIEDLRAAAEITIK